jgi:hypothetical protein
MPKAIQYALGVYVILMFFFLLYLLVNTWPIGTKPDESATLFWVPVKLPSEIRFMFVAAIAGALGSYVHLATSFADYAGNEKLTTNWTWWYILRPFIGTALAEVVYLALRGGLLNASAGDNANTAISPYGVAALAALTGLFSRQATDKLQEVFETLFRTEKKVDRKDPLAVEAPAPVSPQAKAATTSDTP